MKTEIERVRQLSGNIDDTIFQTATKMLLVGALTVGEFREGIDEDYGWDTDWIKDAWGHNKNLSDGNVQALTDSLNKYGVNWFRTL